MKTTFFEQSVMDRNMIVDRENDSLRLIKLFGTENILNIYRFEYIITDRRRNNNDYKYKQNTHNQIKVLNWMYTLRCFYKKDRWTDP